MTFVELLINIIETRKNQLLKVIAWDWEGELLIKGNKIVRAEVEEEELYGLEALKFMIENQSEIRRVEFRPFEEKEPNLNVGQMELFNLVVPREESEGEETETELEVESVEAKVEPEDEKLLLPICNKYFSEEGLKLIVVNGKVELSREPNTEEVLNLIEKLAKGEEETPCRVEKLLIRLEKLFCLILTKDKNYCAVVADIGELPNYELDEPAIDEELLSVLTSQN